MPKEHVFHYFIVALFVTGRNWKQCQFLRTEVWIQKTYTMEYYSAVKNEDILRFAGKWMELNNIILCEVTHTQNYVHGVYSLKVDISQKKKKRTEYPRYSSQNSKRSTS
jgi:hypothetical protein